MPTTLTSSSTSFEVTQFKPNPGDLSASVRLVNYIGSAVQLSNSKHLSWARLQNPLIPSQYRWYKLCGDHSATGDPLDVAINPNDYSNSTFQGGRQEVFSFNTALNDWREDTPYYLPASYGVQGANPDDAGCITVGTEAWVWSSDTNRGISQPGAAASQIDLQASICAYTPPSATWPLGHWRIVCDRPGFLGANRTWRGIYDPVLDRVIIPAGNGSAQFVVFPISDPGNPTYHPMGGDHFFVTAGVAPDFVDRKLYLYDIVYCELWSMNMDTFALTKIADIPEIVLNTQAAVKICWHTALRAVILNITHTHVYQVDTGHLTTFPGDRLDGYVDAIGAWIPASDVFYDPDTTDVFCMGCEDFNEGGSSETSPYFWRIKFSALPNWVPALNNVGVVTTSGINLVDPIIDMAPPHEWDTGTGTNRAVYDNWGSGCYSPDYGEFGALVVAGGGHDGYWGNDVYLLDLNQPDATRKWTRIVNPSRRCGNADLPNFNLQWGEFPDGTPGVPHIYGAASYLPPHMGGGTKGSFIIQVGTYWRGLFVTGASHKVNLATPAWSRASSNFASSGQESTWSLDTLRDRYIGGRTGPTAPSGTLAFLGSFNSSGAGVHTDAGMSSGFFVATDAASEYGPVQDAFFMLGMRDDGAASGTYGIRAWDLTTFVPYDLTITGAFPPACGGPGFVWVPPLGAFYIMCPLQGFEQILYKLVPPVGNWRTGTWTCTQITMAGVTCVGYEFNGMANRFRWAPALKCLVWSQTYNGATYAYRLVR